jgi:hypothetical protein
MPLQCCFLSAAMALNSNKGLFHVPFAPEISQMPAGQAN